MPKDKLYAWVNRCQMAHGNSYHLTFDHLTAKTSQLVGMMQEIKIGSDPAALNMTGIEYLLVDLILAFQKSKNCLMPQKTL